MKMKYKNVKHLFLSFKLSVIAEEKGFNEPCLSLIEEYNEDGNHEILIEEVRFKNEIAKGWIKLPLYQQIIDWFKGREIKIVENPNLNWEIWAKYDNKYILLKSCLTLEEAIEEAFKLI